MSVNCVAPHPVQQPASGSAARSVQQLLRRRGQPGHQLLTLPGRRHGALLDAVRLGPCDDTTAVTAAQLREVVERLIATGHWDEGDPQIWIVADTGYDLPRLAFVLADLPVVVAGRVRSDRVFRFPAVRVYDPRGGRPPKHGPEFALVKPESWAQPTLATSTETERYGTAAAMAWDQLHPRLTHRTCWLEHEGKLPVIEGTLIRLKVEHLPGEREAKPIWLWASLTRADAATVDRLWQAYRRRFDLEHTFRMLKQTLGWTRPRLRNPHAADTWTWLVIAAHTQLRLAREHVADLRHLWERPAAPQRLTPARVRRGFRNIRPALPLPACAPKPSRPGPGRPPGSRNRRAATVQNVGKTVKRDLTITAHDKGACTCRNTLSSAILETWSGFSGHSKQSGLRTGTQRYRW